jgi:endoglucanase
VKDRYKILKKFAEAFGPSTAEDEVREVIKDTLGEGFAFAETGHGNLIAWHVESYKKKAKDNSNVLMLQAHMDELGFRPSGYLDDGFVKIVPLSHVPSSVDNQPIYFKPGNRKGILLVDREAKPSRYYLDVGADSSEAAEKEVPYYAVGTYCSQFKESETDITCKSLDDRAGCALIVESMLHSAKKKDGPFVFGVFTTREETGNWPIPEVVHQIRELSLIPRMFINIEVCPGGPVYDNSLAIIQCGDGIGLVHMERHYTASAKLSHFMVEVARENDIPFQQVSMRDGGGEVGAIAFELGVRGFSYVIPGRYMHSPNSVIRKKDYEAAFSMLKAVMDRGELP